MICEPSQTATADDLPLTSPGQAQAQATPKDPLKNCIFATVALIAWLITPPATVMIMSALGFRAYFRAHRQGMRKSCCLLKDTRIIMTYLGLLFVAGTGFTIWNIVQLFN